MNTSIKTFTYSTLCGLLLCLFMIPLESYAYKSTTQSATRLTEHSALYTVNYYFGGFKTDAYLPIRAERTSESGVNDSQVSYEFLEDGEDLILGGTSAGIVLSDLEVVDNTYYRIPAGKVGRFTLFTLLTLSPEEAEADYALHVSDLPFFVGERDVRADRLNEFELSNYLTPEIELNNYELPLDTRTRVKVRGKVGLSIQ